MADHSALPITPAREAVVVFQGINDAWHAMRPELDWDAAVTAFSDRVDQGGVGRLGLVNCFQWHLEDASRAARHDAAEVARLKEEIDRSNGRRVRTVDAINLELADAIARFGAEVWPDARIVLATPGELLDRLSILELKRCHALRRSDRALADVLGEQIDDLCLGMDDLVDDLRCLRVRMKIYPTVKLYGAAPAGHPGRACGEQ
jgi:hypothetical protein